MKPLTRKKFVESMFASKLTKTEWLIASPGIILVLTGAIGLDNGWPYAFWMAVVGFLYQPVFMAYVTRKGRKKR